MSNQALLPRHFIAPFILVTTLFSLWGFANDITNPMVAAFKNVLLLSHFESSLVQSAFYGGYCAMAIPAALFIRRFTYKSGILAGLGLYALGCLLFIPAGNARDFSFFLAAYFIMTSGLAFLETTANPYILSMGPPETAARRLNFAQAFNPVGSLMGMFIAKDFILARLDPATEAARRTMVESDPAGFEKIQIADLAVIVWPYAILGGVVLLAWWLSGVFGRVEEHPLTLELSFAGSSTRSVEGMSFVAPVANLIDWLILFSDANRRALAALITGVDQLFIESVFVEADREHAQRKNHLTTEQAGEIAREVGARGVVPFHFSPRYAQRAPEVEAQVRVAWGGPPVPPDATGGSEPAGSEKQRWWARAML
jgi:MFS family permease